jgi:hypothetical protein
MSERPDPRPSPHGRPGAGPRRRAARAMRRRFASELGRGVRLVWPILAGLLLQMVTLGCAIALLEGWPLGDGIYFAFVSGLTIGYGDLVPVGALARALAIAIGLTGILLTGLVVAVGVNALRLAAAGARAD